MLALEEIAGDGAVRFTGDDVVVILRRSTWRHCRDRGGYRHCGQAAPGTPGRSALPMEETRLAGGHHRPGRDPKAVMENAPGKPTPKELQAEYQRVLADREIRDTVARIEAAGSPVSYHAVDVRDRAAVTSTLESVRSQHGGITGLVHGAGVLADRFIADKSPADFKRVYGTKVRGLRALLAATSGIAFAASCCSVHRAHASGRKGQADYAMGNEILNKMGQRESRARSDCKVLSINWGPWAAAWLRRPCASCSRGGHPGH